MIHKQRYFRIALFICTKICKKRNFVVFTTATDRTIDNVRLLKTYIETSSNNCIICYNKLVKILYSRISVT